VTGSRWNAEVHQVRIGRATMRVRATPAIPWPGAGILDVVISIGYLPFRMGKRSGTGETTMCGKNCFGKANCYFFPGIICVQLERTWMMSWKAGFDSTRKRFPSGVTLYAHRLKFAIHG